MRIILIIIVYLIPLLGFSQNEEEETIDSFQLAVNESNNLKEKAEIYIEWANKLIDINREESKQKLLAALNLIEQGENYELIGKIYNKLGVAHYKNEEDGEAMQYFIKLDSLFRPRDIVNEDLIRSKYYQAQILKFTYSVDKLKESKNYLDEMLALAKHINDSIQICWSLQRIGRWYGTMSEVENQIENLDTATIYFTQALEYFKRKKEYPKTSSVYWDLASIETRKGNLSKAEKHHRQRLALIENVEDSSEKALVYSTVGGFYLRLKEPQEALRLINKAEVLFKRHGYTTSRDLIDIYKCRSTAYWQMKDYEKAYDYLLLELKAKDSLNRVNNNKNALELETKYQTEKKEQQIKLLEAEKKLEIEKQKRQRLVYLSLIGIAALIGIFFYLQNKSRQKTNEKLRELDKLKSTLFTNVSHELRTPITIIKGLSRHLLDTHKDEIDNNSLKSIYQSSRQLENFANQILTLKEIDENQLKVKYHNSDIVEFLRSYVDLFRSYTNSNGQNLLFDSSPDHLKMDFDTENLQIIINNLLSNAIKFTPQGGSIFVKVDQVDGELKINIEDTGRGIDLSTMQKVFDRHYSGFGSKEQRGFGIGLALTKELVEKMNGEISLQSKPQEGSTFSIVLPITNKAKPIDSIHLQSPYLRTSNIQEKSTSNIESEKPTILIVEDSPEIIDLLDTLLHQEYEILTANHGEDALKILQQKPVNIILSDIMMPHMDGYTLCKKVKSNPNTSHVPFVFLSAKPTAEDRIKGYQLGADDYITKPFDFLELQAILQKLIQKQNKQIEYFSKILELPVHTYDQEEKRSKLDIDFIKNLQEFALSGQKLNTDQLAKLLKVSRTHLYSKLKSLTGQSVSEYMNHVRIQKAKKLLKETDLPINEIAYSIGFEDPPYFSRVFKSIVDKSPSQYRSDI